MTLEICSLFKTYSYVRAIACSCTHVYTYSYVRSCYSAVKKRFWLICSLKFRDILRLRVYSIARLAVKSLGLLDEEVDTRMYRKELRGYVACDIRAALRCSKVLLISPSYYA